MEQSTQAETTQQQKTVKPNRRLGNRKSKQGCLTCKARKVKCDETRPYCKRCENSNRECLGYGDVFVSAQLSKLVLHDRDRSSSRSSSPNSPPFEFSISPEPHSTYSTSKEARSLQYYQTEVSQLLGGSIETSFWTHSILQLSESEPAIRQALVAVSSLWEARIRPDVPDRESCQQRSIEEYTKALTLTAQRVAQPDADNVALATCVLFLCMHYLEDDKDQAEKLLRTGSNVMQTVLEKAWQLRESTSDSTARTFLPIFERMLLLLRLFGVDLPQFRSRDTIAHLTYDFATLDEARGTLYWLISESHDLISDTKIFRNDYSETPEVEWSDEALQAALQRQEAQFNAYGAWQAGFTKLCNERVAFSLSNDMYKATLRLTYTVSIIWLSACFDRDESQADRFQPLYELVTREAGKVIAYNMAASKTDVPFTFEMGLIPPLYLVALKCREPNTRHQAVNLLSRAPAREGLWRREDTLRVVRRVIQVETSGTEVVADGVVFRDAKICNTQTKLTDHLGTHVTFYSKLNGHEEMWKIWDEIIPL